MMNLNKIRDPKRRTRGIKAQEEMVGFGIIVGIVAIIIVVFLSIMLSSPGKDNVESYEVKSFIQSALQYTTDCEDNLGKLTIQELIFDCINNRKCLDERPTCEVLGDNLKGISKESWHIGPGSVVRGYYLEILNNGENITIIQEGNLTGNSKGSFQDFTRSGNSVEIRFDAYY